MKSKTTMSRFMNLTIPEPNSGCWLWIGSTNEHGYGRLGVSGANKHAHRVSYELFVGEIPDNLCVCHRCDVPACVNPQHLFLGTHGDNMFDMKIKNRARNGMLKGEMHPGALLTEDNVKNIKTLIKNGTSLTEIAKLFSVGVSTISMIKSRKNWSHLDKGLLLE